jgi:hypothetical protein
MCGEFLNTIWGMQAKLYVVQSTKRPQGRFVLLGD